MALSAAPYSVCEAPESRRIGDFAGGLPSCSSRGAPFGHQHAQTAGRHGRRRGRRGLRAHPDPPADRRRVRPAPGRLAAGGRDGRIGRARASARTPPGGARQRHPSPPARVAAAADRRHRPARARRLPARGCRARARARPVRGTRRRRWRARGAWRRRPRRARRPRSCRQVAHGLRGGAAPLRRSGRGRPDRRRGTGGAARRRVVHAARRRAVVARRPRALRGAPRRPAARRPARRPDRRHDRAPAGVGSAAPRLRRRRRAWPALGRRGARRRAAGCRERRGGRPRSRALPRPARPVRRAGRGPRGAAGSREPGGAGARFRAGRARAARRRSRAHARPGRDGGVGARAGARRRRRRLGRAGRTAREHPARRDPPGRGACRAHDDLQRRREPARRELARLRADAEPGRDQPGASDLRRGGRLAALALQVPPAAPAGGGDHVLQEDFRNGSELYGLPRPGSWTSIATAAPSSSRPG